jgi:hypothetical protein
MLVAQVYWNLECPKLIKWKIFYVVANWLKTLCIKPFTTNLDIEFFDTNKSFNFV